MIVNQVLVALISLLAVSAEFSVRKTTINYCGAYTDGVIQIEDVFDYSPFKIALVFNDRDYYNNTYCVLKFKAGNVHSFISLTLEKFNVEYEEKCRHDFLCLNGIRFCGNRTNDESYFFFLPADKTFTIKFMSDPTVSASGFKITGYTTTRGTVLSTFQPLGIEYATSPIDTSNYRWVDESNYVDLCA